MKKNIQSPEFRKLLENHLTLLKPYRHKKSVFTAELRVRGYSDIAYHIADLLKVSIMALDSEHPHGASPLISEPNLNIAGVLEIALALLPYEEFELLDILQRELEKEEEPAYNYSTVRVLQ